MTFLFIYQIYTIFLFQKWWKIHFLMYLIYFKLKNFFYQYYLFDTFFKMVGNIFCFLSINLYSENNFFYQKWWEVHFLMFQISF